MLLLKTPQRLQEEIIMWQRNNFGALKKKKKWVIGFGEDTKCCTAHQ